MKTETYDYSTIDEAIERLQKLKAEGKNPKNVVILTMDFDNNTSSKKIATPDDGCLLVKKSKTIIMNEDEYIPHMQLFNTEQDIKNIIRRGIMHDILLWNVMRIFVRFHIDKNECSEYYNKKNRLSDSNGATNTFLLTLFKYIYNHTTKKGNKFSWLIAIKLYYILYSKSIILDDFICNSAIYFHLLPKSKYLFKF